VTISPPTAPSGTALPLRAANEAYRNAQKRAYQQPSPSIDDFINTIGHELKQQHVSAMSVVPGSGRRSTL